MDGRNVLRVELHEFGQVAKSVGQIILEPGFVDFPHNSRAFRVQLSSTSKSDIFILFQQRYRGPNRMSTSELGENNGHALANGRICATRRGATRVDRAQSEHDGRFGCRHSGTARVSRESPAGT